MSQKSEKTLTKEEFVMSRCPEVEVGSPLFKQLVDLQKFNPLFKNQDIKVYDHVDWVKEQAKRASMATQIKLKGGKVKKNIYV